MITMTLNSRHEAVSLHTYIIERIHDPLILSITDDTLVVKSANGHMSEPLKKRFADVLTGYIIDTYEERWLLDIISGTFYFTKAADQEVILAIAQAIFEGEKPDLPSTDTLPSRQHIVHTAIEDLLKGPSVFSFRSLETFRLSEYYNCLTHTVELAIDEYKLQQEYAAFVDKLRRIVKAYRPLRETVYAVDQNPFVLYDEHFKPLRNVQSVRSFYPLLKQWGIEAEPSILLTLIGLAPKNIHIYTDRQDEGMMRTMQNVFEERVVFHPMAQAQMIHL